MLGFRQVPRGAFSLAVAKQVGEIIVVGLNGETHLFDVRVTVIHGCDAADRPRNMIQQLFCHMDWSADFCVDGSEGPPEIMERKRRNII